jgi:cobalt-zinc-cadmium efflux system outer membrane protein
MLTQELDSLIAEATSARPDLRAASFAIAAAQQRASLARKQWLRFDLVGDANSGGAGPTNFGPGLRFDIPIFDRNQGGVHSADWMVNQATQNYNAIYDQVVADVQVSYSQYHQANENLTQLRTSVLTSLDQAVRLAGKAFSGGGTSYFLVLQTTTQYLDARVREIQLSADLRRAAANLDRSVGRNVTWQQPQLVGPERTPFVEDVTPPSQSRRVESDSEPNILILSKDGSALFSGRSDRQQVGNALRRIADQLEAMDGKEEPFSDTGRLGRQPNASFRSEGDSPLPLVARLSEKVHDLEGWWHSP